MTNSRGMQLVRMRNKERALPPIVVKKPRYSGGGAVPAFDPSQPFESVAASSSAPAFDPSQPFEAAVKPAEKSFTDKLGETWPARVAKDIYHAVTLPGDVASGTVGAPKQFPASGGMLSDEDVARQQLDQGEIEKRALGLAGLGPIAPEFLAAKKAVPAVIEGAVAPTGRDAVIAASERLGVPIPRAAASESIPVQSTAGALKEISIVGAPLVKASKDALAGMDEKVGNIVAGYGSGQPLQAGQAATSGIENWITSKSADVAKRLYDPVDTMVTPDFTRPLHATNKIVADIMAKRANARISGASPAVNEVADAIADTAGLNYQGVKDLRTHLRDMTPQEMVAKGINKAEAKRIYGALTQDLRGTILDAGGPKALNQFDKANRIYDTIADKREALSKVIGTSADAAPEAVMAKITSMAGSKSSADYSKLAQIRKAVGADNWNEITSAFVNKMGRNSPEAEFSGDRFKSAWDAMPANTRRLMFNSTGRTDLAKSVEDIMTLSDAHKSLMKYGNPSGTGRVGTLAGMAGAFWAAPLATIASAVGGNIAARVLAQPVAAKSAANWTKAYVNASTHPNPYTMNVLKSASDGMAKTINGTIGGNFSGMDFMRKIQGPVPAGAEQQNQQQ